MTSSDGSSSNSGGSGAKTRSVHTRCRVCALWDEYDGHPLLQGRPCPMCKGVGLGLRSAIKELIFLDPGGETWESIESIPQLLQWYRHVEAIRERHTSARARMEELEDESSSKNSKKQQA